MTVSLDDLNSMTQAELDDLYRASAAGEIPDGDTSGTGIVLPGTWFERVIARIIRWFVWQGKVFDAKGGALINKVSVAGVQAIRAKVYKDPSWLDGKECIVIDYSKTSFVAKKVRDEIREVAPGLYLGKVYWGKARLIDFALVSRRQRQTVPFVSPWRAAVLVLCVVAAYFAWRFTRDEAVTHADPIDHFKYGSAGGERASGIPLAIWDALPTLFADLLPAGNKDRYKAFGFIYESNPDGTEKDLPIGVSRRNVQGVDRVFVNCAVCHVGTVRETPSSPRRIYAGMPSNGMDLGKFEDFLFACASDPRFNSDRVMAEIVGRHGGGGLDLVNRGALRYYGVPMMRERLLMLKSLFAFTGREPEFGPGRVDTFNPPKAMLGFPMDKLPMREWVGIADFPSIWLQRPRKTANMNLHWDGNNTEMEERNKSAAYGTGAFPTTLDHELMKRTEDWLLDVEPPAYPFAIDRALAARGAPLYAAKCADCHGKNGRDFSGKYVGQVTPIEAIGTDRARLDSYSYELCVDQNTLYAGEPGRFKHFKKTFGYANQPLDGVWLRGPYLHNGSVPTLRELLEPADKRSVAFYRGFDVFDQKRVGFVSDVAAEGGREFFLVETNVVGNRASGHTGAEYGTELSPEEKDAIVEYLKTF